MRDARRLLRMHAADSHQPVPVAASIPFFASHVSMHPKREAATHCAAAPSGPCRPHWAAVTVPPIPIPMMSSPHTSMPWMSDPLRVELQVKHMIVAAASRHIC